MPCSLRRLGLLLSFAFLLVAGNLPGQSYTGIVVFGDSLSDTGNIAHLSQSTYGVRLPSPAFGYTDGRFTDGTDTLPPATLYTGVWIEQLAATLPAKPVVKASLDGGTNYAYGDAATGGGVTSVSYGTTGLSLSVNNLGQQVSDYLGTAPVLNGNTLFVVWGGSNDVLKATSAADITTAVSNEIALIQRLIAAGATDFLVPNLPPLGAIPRLNGSPTVAAQATAAAQAYGTALFQALAALPAANPGKTLHLFPLDAFTLFSQVIAAPATYQLDNVTSTSQFKTVDPDRYLFWEDLHPTTTGHHLLALAAGKLITPVVLPTTTTLTSSATGSNLNANLTFTATVASTGGSPTGTVIFLEGSTTLGTGTLTASGANAAIATFQTSSLSAGSHTVTATYVAAAPFTASTSNAVTVTVTAPAITSALTPTAITISRGATGTTTVTVTPVGGYSGSVTLACGTVPAHISCTFSSSTLNFTGDNTLGSSTLTISTRTVAHLSLPGRLNGAGAAQIACALLLPGWLLLGSVGRKRRKNRWNSAPRLLSRCGAVLLGASALALLLGVSGCAGSDNRAPAGNYTVPVNITAGANTSTLNLQLTVQ